MSDEKLRLAFNKYDTDGNGYIDLSELKNLLEDLGKPSGDLFTSFLFKKADKNKDNKISFEEFKALLTSK